MSWGEEWAGPGLDADLRWSVAALAEQEGDWRLQLRVGREEITLLPDEAARFMENLMRAWHCVTSAREQEALYA